MSVYKNENGTLKPIASNNKIVGQPLEGLVTKEEFDVKISDMATKEDVDSQLVSTLSDGIVEFKLTFESGFITDQGAPSLSVHWVRTPFFNVSAPTTLKMERLTTGSAGNTLRFYTYSDEGTFEDLVICNAKYDTKKFNFELNPNKKYRMCINYGEPSTINTQWKMQLLTNVNTLITNMSNTITRNESMSVADFNSRDVNDNAMINDAQYTIFSNPFMIFHNGMVGTPVGERNYLAKFALLSDAHIGGASYTQTTKNQYLNSLAHINSLNVDFTIELGDNVDNGYDYTPKVTFDEQTEEHKAVYRNLNSPLFSFGGNHDTGVSNYSPYGTIDYNGVRIIKFHADYAGLAVPEGRSETVWSTGVVPTSQLEYIQNQLATSKAKVNIVACHYPIAIDETYAKFKWWIMDDFTDRNGNARDGHRDDLLEILNEYNVKLYLSGHEHTQTYDNFGQVGDIYNYSSPNFQKAYTIVTVKETEIVFEYYDIATNTSRGTRTISLVNSNP